MGPHQPPAIDRRDDPVRARRTSLAYYIATRRASADSLHRALVTVLDEPLIRKHAWLTILGRRARRASSAVGDDLWRILGTEWAVQLGPCPGYHLPLMVFPLRDRAYGPVLVEASKDLGAGRWATFRQITFPIALPGVITGSILVFIPMIGEYVIPNILGYGRVFTVGSALVLRFLEARDWPVGSAQAVVVPTCRICWGSSIAPAQRDGSTVREDDRARDARSAAGRQPRLPRGRSRRVRRPVEVWLRSTLARSGSLYLADVVVVRCSVSARTRACELDGRSLVRVRPEQQESEKPDQQP
jgi:hypothetical protein